MACHFTYRLESVLGFGESIKNTDGSDYNDSNYLANDWATVFKKIKVGAAVNGLSNIAVCINVYFFDEQRPADVPITEYFIGDGLGYTLIGYNFSAGQFTITHFDSEKNPLSNPLTDYRFDSGAGSINDFYTHMVRDLYADYMDSIEARETMQFIVSSMGGPKITHSGERAYVGSGIPLNRLSEIPMDQLTKLLSISHPHGTYINLLMTLCTSSDSEQGLCTVKSVDLTDSATATTSSVGVPGSAISTSISGPTATVSIDLSTIDDYWARLAKSLRLNYWYW